MSAPFIIWTMQRTGGTSLAELLMEMSEHTAAEHEPFNWAKKKPRQFWAISEAWNASGDSQMLRQSLKCIFEQKFLIKHCYELLNLTFNMHLIHESSITPYRHVILRRRDEASRLISKFIAEAEGTWFKDYSRKVFSEVASGERQLKELPIDRLVGHYRHSQNATKFVTDTLEAFGAESHTIFYEDLYVGEREPRMERLAELFDFLEFSEGEVQKHATLIGEKVFNSGQSTSSVATHVPNYLKALQALNANGCDVATRLLESDAAAAPQTFIRPVTGTSAEVGPSKAASEPASSYARIAREVIALVKGRDARGPFLEISNTPVKHSVLRDPYFMTAERHVLSKTDAGTVDSLVMQKDVSSDMRSLYTAGHFGTVLWIDTLATDKHFWLTLSEIRRILAPGGVLIAVTPSFGKAGHNGVVITGAKGNAIADVTLTKRVHASSDYWRISPQGMRDVVFEGFDVTELRVMMVPPRLFGVATKQRDAVNGVEAATPIEQS